MPGPSWPAQRWDGRGRGGASRGAEPASGLIAEEIFFVLRLPLSALAGEHGSVKACKCSNGLTFKRHLQEMTEQESSSGSFFPSSSLSDHSSQAFPTQKTLRSPLSLKQASFSFHSHFIFTLSAGVWLLLGVSFRPPKAPRSLTLLIVTISGLPDHAAQRTA